MGLYCYSGRTIFTDIYCSMCRTFAGSWEWLYQGAMQRHSCLHPRTFCLMTSSLISVCNISLAGKRAPVFPWQAETWDKTLRVRVRVRGCGAAEPDPKPCSCLFLPYYSATLLNLWAWATSKRNGFNSSAQEQNLLPGFLYLGILKLSPSCPNTQTFNSPKYTSRFSLRSLCFICKA